MQLLIDNRSGGRCSSCMLCVANNTRSRSSLLRLFNNRRCSFALLSQSPIALKVTHRTRAVTITHGTCGHTSFRRLLIVHIRSSVSDSHSPRMHRSSPMASGRSVIVHAVRHRSRGSSPSRQPLYVACTHFHCMYAVVHRVRGRSSLTLSLIAHTETNIRPGGYSLRPAGRSLQMQIDVRR
jgi:hypothetical protein